MRLRMSHHTGRAVLSMTLLIVIAASMRSSVKQDKPIYKPNGGEGSIIGTISFDGIPPKSLVIDTSADPVCEALNPDLRTDWVMVADHKLQNVVVYLRGDSLNSYSFDAPSTGVTLEHKGCRYVPHVLGMQATQTLRIVNRDPTTHNTHPTPKVNAEWNQSQPPDAAAIERRLEPELFIPVKDNQHPWEKAYVGVFTHPFFAVSASDGTYRISGVPPGQYSVVAWHERLGEQALELFVGGGEEKRQDFKFKPSNR